LAIGREVAALLDSSGKGIKCRDGIFPVDASICDADAVFEASLALGGNFLVS
jgi:hypothetical protein